LKIQSCRYERSARDAGSEPAALGPAAVFLGRSNVGKSSLINRLLGTRNLARTSSTPGRTRAVNFYMINERFRFVDLPGYGYAKVSKAEQARWAPMVEGFLERHAREIRQAVLLLDARHRPREADRTMQAWLEHRGIPYLVVATKSDKLSGNGRAAAARKLREELPGLDAAPIMASAETGAGIAEIWRHLDAALVVGGAERTGAPGELPAAESRSR
jgi:GTP-binding protein